MAAWKKIIFIYLCTAMIGALTYVSAVVIFEDGRGLGEHMWGGFIIQVFLLSTHGLIYGLVFLLPLLLLLEKFLDNFYIKIASFTVVTFLFLTGSYIMYSGIHPLASLKLSIFASSIIFVIQYLTMRSKGTDKRLSPFAAP